MGEFDTLGPEQPQEKVSKTMAVISLICGILSILFFFLGVFSFVFGIAALALGIISLAKKKGAKGLAIAGIACGGIGFLIGVLSLWYFWGVYLNAVENGEYNLIFEDMMDYMGLGADF